MAFRWSCDPAEFVEMGATYRPAIGYKRERGETWADAASRVIPENYGPLLARWLYHTPQLWNATILDFGAGAGAVQVRALARLVATEIVGYEWPPEEGDKSKRAVEYWKNVDAGFLDPDALERKYSVVLASNVLNVQPSWGCFHLTLSTIKSVMDRGGYFVANLASEPRRIWRKGRAGDRELDALLEAHFAEVTTEQVIKRDGTFSSDWIWVCSGPRPLSAARERGIVRDLAQSGALAWDKGLRANPAGVLLPCVTPNMLANIAGVR